MYYIIFATSRYRTNSGGVKVLYELSSQLNKHGHESCVYFRKRQTPIERYNIRNLEFVLDKIKQGAWVIYPSIAKGNPLKAKNVIRYALGVRMYLRNKKTYGENEITFAYNSYISKGVGNYPILTTPHINLDICKDYGMARKGSCFFVHKGRDVPRRPELERIEIINTTSEQLYGICNSSEVFYTYDDMTSCVEEARLCGCPVVLLKENSDKLEFLSENKYGMAFNLSELDWAKETVHKFRELYIEQYPVLFEKQLKLFLKLTSGVGL